ncbi:hypothetical protein HAX54_020052 [Datura stramonium]|uniref:Uncharacterized protein n=1 Tax=Datura stramonium TaxID=4076 RepID=A0ABS8USB9_DATST|nr:hypothetical protein [Datura stramonium]
MVLDDEALFSQLVESDTENPPQVVEESPETVWESHQSSKAQAKGKQLTVPKEPFEGPGATVKKSIKKDVIEESSKDIVRMHGMQELLEMVRFQGWEHLFEPPMPIMYESEVSDFYSSLMFTDEEETVYATMSEVDIPSDLISLGRILDVSTDGEFMVKDK